MLDLGHRCSIPQPRWKTTYHLARKLSTLPLAFRSSEEFTVQSLATDIAHRWWYGLWDYHGHTGKYIQPLLVKYIFASERNIASPHAFGLLNTQTRIFSPRPNDYTWAPTQSTTWTTVNYIRKQIIQYSDEKYAQVE